MDADEQGLLAAVRDDPWDDTPRLVYADWCDDHGQPERAGFVRVQLELATLREPGYKTGGIRLPDDHRRYDAGSCVACHYHVRCHWHVLALRAKALLDAHSWWAALPEPSWPTLDVWEMRRHASAALVGRGFVAGVRLPSRMWELHGKAIVLRHPVTRGEVSGKRPGVGRRLAWWWRSNGDGREDSGSTLPGDVFDGLRGGILHPVTELNAYAIREYDRDEEAYADLSRFIIGRARMEAGLPPLAERG